MLGDSCRTRRNSVSPSTFGSRMSQSITSKTFDEMKVSPSAPLPARRHAVAGITKSVADQGPEVGLIVYQKYVEHLVLAIP